ncbi:MAG: hypothetical protein ACYSSO_07345, partial [Planctomycetota bacterium]
IKVEKISKCDCHGRECSFCETEVATGRVTTQTWYQYRSGEQRVCFNFCEKCGKDFARKMGEYSGT